MSTQKQARLLSQKPEIIVATPGRFWELLEEVRRCREAGDERVFDFVQNNEHIVDMSNLRFVAIDETDRMIEKGHFEELEKILNLINRYTVVCSLALSVIFDFISDEKNQSRQKFVFSATLMLQPTDDNDRSSSKKKKNQKQKKKGDNQDKLGLFTSNSICSLCTIGILSSYAHFRRWDER